MNQKGYYCNPDEFPSLGKQSVRVSTVTKTSQPSQSEFTLENLTRIIAEWTDLSLAVILAGKLESLLTQYLVYDIYNYWDGVAVDILKRLENFKDEVIRDFYCSKELKWVADSLRENTSRLAKPLREMLRDYKSEPFKSKPYKLEQVDKFDWFENLETRERFSTGCFQPQYKAELKKMALGLMHEWISVICSRHYKEIVRRMPKDFLKDLEKKLGTKTFIDTRNKIVHCRTIHGFKSGQEREIFLEFYTRTSKTIIKEENCFFLLDDYEARLSYT